MPRSLELVLLTVLQPLSLLLLVMLLGLLLRHWVWRLLALMALVAVWLLSTPMGAERLAAPLESRFEGRSLDGFREHQAIVLLGGGVAIDPRQRGRFDLMPAADRMFHAAALWHAGRAPEIIATGGLGARSDWSEAHAMREVLLALGVPDEAIRLETRSRTTREHPANVADMLAERGEPVLLVTSALHMPRAVANFRTAGVGVTPAPTDFELLAHGNWRDWAPDARALDRSTRALKERIGLLHLRLLGMP